MYPEQNRVTIRRLNCIIIWDFWKNKAFFKEKWKVESKAELEKVPHPGINFWEGIKLKKFVAYFLAIFLTENSVFACNSRNIKIQILFLVEQ